MSNRLARPGSIVILLVLMVVVMATVLLGVLAPTALCPKCQGEGLLAEPVPPPGKAIWVSVKDLIPLKCDTCLDRHKVTLIKKWHWRREWAPSPPIYRSDQVESFIARQRGRIKQICLDVVDGTGGWPPSAPTRRPDLILLLAEALRDNDQEIQQHAVRALAQANHPDAMPPLVAALGSGSAAVRTQACQGLEFLARSRSQPAPVVAVLTPLLDYKNEADFNVRLSAATVLFELGELRDPGVFLEALKTFHERLPVVRRAIASFGCKQAILLVIRQFITTPAYSAEDKDSWRETLEQLTGEQLGDDVVRWYRWFEKNRANFPVQLE